MYSLSRQFKGHSQDVKSLVSYKSTILSCSRDSTVIVWTDPITILTTHDSKTFVNSIAYIPPSDAHPQGLVVSGSNQKQIHVVDPLNPSEPMYILLGHDNNICSLKVIPDTHEIISGSWDNTVKVWKNYKMRLNLTGHSAAVWDVLYAPENGYILSASADKTIKVWDYASGKNISTLTGHTDVVRGLSLIPSVGFVSASNDATLRVWNFKGESLHVLYGHSSFIYTVSVLPTGEIVSAGEDRCVKVFKGTQVIQSLPQPCTSLWSLTVLENGDFAVGGSDGVIRVFTRSSSRTASAQEMQAFQDLVAHQAVPSNQIGDLDTSKVAGTESLDTPGTKEGQVKLIKSANGQVDAYQWDSSAGKWIQIGQVVEAVGQNRKQVFEGKEVDYVFDVDIQEGMPPLKLPFNSTENPYQAAQDFINKNELNQDYLDEIAQFIIKNTQGVTLGSTTASSYADPYTGASRYVPPGGPTTTESTSESTRSSLFPIKQYIVFKSGNLNSILNKLESFDSEIQNLPDLTHLSIKNQVSILKQILDSLDTNSVLELELGQVKLLNKLAFEWPEEYRFPGIDLLNSVILVSSSKSNLLTLSRLDEILVRIHFSDSMNKTSQTNTMLEIRFLCNSCLDFGDLMYSRLDKILQILSLAYKAPPNKNLRIAIATWMLNIVILLSKCIQQGKTIPLHVIESLFTLILQFVSHDKELESHTRAWMALGTLVSIGYGSIALVQNTKHMIQQEYQLFKDEKMVQLLNELEFLL